MAWYLFWKVGTAKKICSAVDQSSTEKKKIQTARYEKQQEEFLWVTRGWWSMGYTSFFFLRREKLPKHISSATCLLPKRVRNLISQQRPEGADSLMWERAGWVKPGGLGEPTGVKAPAASPRVGRPGPVSLCSLCRWISWVLLNT